MNPYNPYAPQQASRGQVGADSSAFLRKVYAYMAGGLLATALTASAVASSETLVEKTASARAPLPRCSSPTRS